MTKALKKFIRKIKRRLIKKVEVTKHHFSGNEVVFDFQLTNYFLPLRNVKAELLIDEETHALKAHNEGNKRIIVEIPEDLLTLIESKGTLKVLINNKKVWITEHSSYRDADFHETLLIGEKYLSSRVKRNIIIRNWFSDFNFVKEEKLTEVKSASYESLELDASFLTSDVPDSMRIYAFNNRKFRSLELHYDKERRSMRIRDFSEMAAGIWRMFIEINDYLYPLQLKHVYDSPFHSLRHRIKTVQRNGGFYLEFVPNSLEVEKLSIQETEDHSFVLKMSLAPQLMGNDYALILDDYKQGTQSFYAFDRQSDQLIAEIPAEDLYDSFFVKRFFIHQQSEEPKIHQFVIDDQLQETQRRFKVIAFSQFIKLRFYKRKDKSLGLKLTKAKLKKSISSVEDFELSGMIGSIEEFIGAKAFLLLEDRNSLESLQLPISGEFTIDLKDLDLIGLKSKDKTILDFFVIIENAEGEVIRKEKIKYTEADYKKDNYYSYRIVEDQKMNEHHFLITTTPFNNLKVESFTIPSSISVPADPSVKDDNIWLIGERSNTAQDNGIVLFKWLQQNTDVEAYYVIEEDSLDYLAIQHLPNVLTFGSAKHFEIAFKAKVLLCTHDLENILPYKPAAGFFGYENTRKIFLQHGVLGRKNVEYHKKYYELPFDLFIVSSDPEKYEVVMEEMGYEEKEVAVTGLARFDQLIQKEKPRDILLMPTWRDWIVTDEQFLNSEYYLAYTSLIQNEKLLSLLETYNINLNFYPHYRAQNYFEKGTLHLHDRIRFIPLGSDTVQNLLIKHALLITDYSTVSFDFTLLDKPAVFYHFDVDRFFRRGILRPVEETFIGGIASYEEELVNIIEDRIKHDFSNFEMDISGIIKYQDRKNCERIYQKVKALFEEVE